jgi:putative SOS response-associated peptidase YedK
VTTPGKTPFAVARVDGNPFAFGGIWETWKPPDGELLQTFATITTDANRQLAAIQDRMPAIIERKHWPLWLGESEGDPGQLLRTLAEDVLRVWRTFQSNSCIVTSVWAKSSEKCPSASQNRRCPGSNRLLY